VRILQVVTLGGHGGAQVHVRGLLEQHGREHEVVLATGTEGALTDAAREMNVPVHIVPSLQRAISPGVDLRATRELRALFKRVDPDVINLHSFKAQLLGVTAAAGLDYPVVVTSHGWNFNPGLSPVRRAIAVLTSWWMRPWVSSVISVCGFDDRMARRFHAFSPEVLRVVYNGVEDRALPAVASAGILRVVMVARFAEEKRHEQVIDAVRGLDGIEVRFIGDGVRMDEMIAYAKGAPVVFMGRRSDIPEQLAASDVAVLMSSKEGFPLVTLEAMSAGLPVVASDVAGIPEAVRDQETGYIVGAGDSAALRQRLLGLRDDPALRDRLGKAGRAAFERDFDLRVCAERTLAVYRELAGN